MHYLVLRKPRSCRSPRLGILKSPLLFLLIQLGVNICKLNVSATSGPESKVAPVTYIPPELPSDINELFQDAPHSGLNFDKYDEIPVKVTGKEIPSAIDTFEQAGILEQCSANIKMAKFIKPTPIQKHAIPIVLAGRDLMPCAQTGSGKTVSKENDIFKISAFSE